MKNARQIAYDTLMRVCFDKAYSNIAFDKAVKAEKLSKQDASFAAALLYGILESPLLLDYAISKYLKKPITSLDDEVLTILRMGIYQLMSMGSVPESAAVNESVGLCAYAKKTSAKGFVNAILRSFIRDGKKADLTPLKNDKLKFYSIKYSCPLWLLKQWSKQYGEETAIALAEASIGSPPISIRVNTLKTTTENLLVYFKNHGVEAVPHEWLENCITLKGAGSIAELGAYKQGLFYVQDVSSQLCAAAACAKPDDIVLDLCAAPGSKSFTIAQSMQGKGKIYAFDLFEHKIKLIADTAKRLGITNIECRVQDASVHDNNIPMADCVLCDVPCSGLGVLKRKPEIKQKKQAEHDTLPAIQQKILQNASSYVKPGGTLVYSTCTLNKKENDEVIKNFLQENISFIPLHLSEILGTIKVKDSFPTTLFPHVDATDGFFIAAMRRSR